MSEQIPLDSLQLVAQVTPQAQNSAPQGQPAGDADFHNILAKQELGEGAELFPGLPDESPPLIALNQTTSLPASVPGGNSLPDGGSALQLLRNATSGLPSQKDSPLANLLFDPLEEGAELPASESLRAASSKVLTVDQLQQQVTDSRQASPLPNALASSQLVDNRKPLTPIASSERAAPQINVENLLQNLLGSQQESLQAASRQADTAQLQQTQVVTPQVAQPQANVVPYNAVAQNTSAALPTETGSLASQPLPTLDIGVPVKSAEWNRAFAERAVWMVNNQQSAHLRLTPASLGQIDVQIKINDEEASIVFNTQNGVVKETVESAIPRLREMLESQGLNLVDVNVNERSTSDKDNPDMEFAENSEHNDSEESVEPEVMLSHHRLMLSAQGVDIYA